MTVTLPIETTQTHVFERGDLFYIVGPVAPYTPAAEEVEELAFAQQLREVAPNENIMWLRGQYVEADRPNSNGALWTADELAIKSLTPMFMPVNVMHDPRANVGLIADVRLLTREKDGVQRSRIDTTLGLWAHRFPEIAEEVQANYEQGALMQSMECQKAWYECGACDMRFPNLGGLEKANWCEHLKAGETAAANARPVRRLGNVTFTGTGLIFGTRGAVGAFDAAHLDVFEEEVAEAHERAHRDRHTAKPKRRPGHMEIEDTKYQDLLAKASRVDDLEKKVTDLEESAGKVPELENKVEKAEADAATEKQRADDAEKKVKDAEEQAAAAGLAKERLDKLGKDFVAKLGDFTKSRLEEQAKTYSDEDWDSRLKELEEIAQVKRDEGGSEPEGGDNDVLDREETARAGSGGAGGGNGSGGGGNGGEPTPQQRRSTIGGLAKRVSA